MADDDSYMILNVGGICYTTSRLTLTSCPDSMLGIMFSEGGVPPKADKNGHFFIDRDGAMFRYILNFIRDGRLCLPSSFEEYDQLLAEAEFFQLSALKEEVLSRMNPQNASEVNETNTGKEVVILKNIHPWSTDTLYVVEATKQTWPRLKSLASVQSVELPPYAASNKVCFDNDIKGYRADCCQLVALVIKDGFKLETAVPPSEKNFLIFT
ncbi:BTB/POZ domain-containing protein KCTD21 [Holothuria leucospilota]|uniref:BTB/POZ domain-containing protein KCTD21 n=1 Tax=Holothuria leucospilota TaxID=206669 RepID=A0A9Q0YKA5_HOLLE|nr:BTB/POZ domain-containing protein KCTD21 [Holothuria leucospilota]